MIGSCHCGAVTIQASLPPAEVTECNCSVCRCYGVLWAYYQQAQVHVRGRTDIYTRGDETIAFHRCAVCGCVSHWAPVRRDEDRMGVNARLMDVHFLARAKVRHLDGALTERYLD